jgi:iron complex transport system substrate-binding protein
VKTVLLTLLAYILAASPATAQTTARPTVISLVPAVTEMLFAIGAGPQVIGVSSYDKHPPEVARLPKMGALLDPNTEQILAARPGLVISYGSQSDLQTQLRRAGIGVFSYRHGGLAGIYTSIEEVGRATGHGAEASRLMAGLRARLDAVRAKTAGRPKPRTLLVMGREAQTLRNLNASGGVGFLHDILEIAGGANAFGDVKREAVTVSSEMLLGRAPDVVLDLHYGVSEPPDRARARQDAAVWQAVPSVPAVRNKRVIPLYGDHFVVPGPRIADAAEAMARMLHPEAFK